MAEVAHKRMTFEEFTSSGLDGRFDTLTSSLFPGSEVRMSRLFR